ncbi:putative serine/threonine-protein kinase iks1 [Coemansia sp. RSA 487]|nr:putative serine/threonine-protein kinase iks1 [Coemansia sp. RSA 986]KAJ2214704.1 putative serine/threonine-protein kinase iks1 [Coemansia sp. RSA 487]
MGKSKKTDKLNSALDPPKKLRGKSQPVAGAASVPSSFVSWPSLKTKKGLSVTELVSNHIFLLRGIFDRAECDAFIQIADEHCIPTPGIPKRGEAFRNNARWSTVSKECAQRVWLDTGMAKLLSDWKHPDGRVPVGLLENIRLYSYGPRQRFGKHYDDYFFDSKGRRTEYTLLIYLNSIDDPRFGIGGQPSGGETVFYARRMEPVSVKPEAGLALLHKHGADCLQHEALELRNSYKYVLRSDVVFGYKRPTGQIVLYNQEDNGVEVRHVVPHRLGVLHSQESAEMDERRVVGRGGNTSRTSNSGLLEPLERKASVCPTCLRPLSRYSESSWDPHVVSETYSDHNDTITTDRDYFKVLARYLKLQKPQFSLEDSAGKIEEDQQPYYDSDDKYYKRQLQNLPDISHFQIGGERSHVLEDTKEDYIKGAVSSELLEERLGESDNDNDNDNEKSMLISSVPNDSTSESRTMAEEKSASTDGVSAKSFNQGYYERFFTEQNKLGKGLRGSVFSCQHVLDGVFLGHYAVKKVAVGNNHVWLKRMLREVKLLESLRHPNVVEYKHSWLEMHGLTNFGPRVPCLFILMEYANGGNLQEYMEPKIDSADAGISNVSLKQQILNRRKQKRHIADSIPSSTLNAEIGGSDGGPRVLSIDQIWSFFSDICNGLAHLHQLQIIHRDLKHMNLLLHWNDPANKETSGETPRLMLTDFGECEILSQLEKRNRTGATGTLEFMAPELIEVDSMGRYLDSYSTKADMWSLGIVLYYLCYSRLPYVDVDDLDVLRRDILSLKHIDYTKIRRPPYAEDIPSELQGIMQQLLNHSESKRPNINDIIHQITEKRSLWHNRRYDASRFEIHDSDAASNGTNTPGSMTPRLNSIPRMDKDKRKYCLEPRNSGDSSKFPIVLLSGRGTEESTIDSVRNVPLSTMFRRHSVGLVISRRRDSGLEAKNDIEGSSDSEDSAINETAESNLGISEDDFNSHEINVGAGSKRRLDLSSVSNANTAFGHKRPKYMQATKLRSDQEAPSAFIAKTAIMLIKMYFLQTLDIHCDEQRP